MFVVASASVFVASRSFFYADDFLYANFFTSNDVSRAILLRSYFGHLVPGFVLLDTAFYRSVGMAWPLASAMMVFMNVGLTVASIRLLDATSRPRRMHAVAGVMIGLSLPILFLLTWWGAAVTNLVPLAAGISFLGCATRWARTRRARHLVAAFAMYGLALAFYEKSLLFSAFAVLWTVLVLDRDASLKERLQRFLSRWLLWLGVAALSLVVLFLYLSGDFRDESGTGPSWAVIGTFAARAVFLGLVPSLFGFDLQLSVWSEYVRVIAITTNVALFVVVVWAFRRVPRSASVFSFAVLVILLGQIPLAIGRAGIAGPDGGRLLRYQIEGAVVLVLVLTLMAGMLVDRPRAHRSTSAGRRIVAAFLVVGGAAAWCVSMTESIRLSPGVSARQWATEARASLPASRPFKVVDGTMPGNFLYGWQYPYNMVSHALPLLFENAVVTADPDGALALGPDGAFRPFEMAESARVASDACAPANVPMVVTFPAGTLTGSHILVDFDAQQAGTISVATGVGDVFVDPAGTYLLHEVEAGPGSVVVVSGVGLGVDHVRVMSSTDTCISSVVLGTIAVS